MTVTATPRGIERRRHRRVAADLVAGCRRLGSRSTSDTPMGIVDISQGGAHLEGGADIRTGDVLLVTIDIDKLHVELKGLVVSAHSNVTNPDPISVHVAWTSVSSDCRDALGSLLAAVATVDV